MMVDKSAFMKNPATKAVYEQMLEALQGIKVSAERYKEKDEKKEENMEEGIKDKEDN